MVRIRRCAHAAITFDGRSPLYFEAYAGISVWGGSPDGGARRRRRARRSIGGFAKWWRGISIRPRGLRSGSSARKRSAGIRASGFTTLCRSETLRRVRGRVAARRSRAALGSEGMRRQAGVSCSKPVARPASRRRASTARTSGSTTRSSARRFRTSTFPKGANWLMLGPSGPRRLRLAVEHLCQHRGGICFCVDLDPRWVIKLIKKGWSDHLNAYKDHVIDQAVTILHAGHDIKCMFTTPKLLEALALRLESMGTSIGKVGHQGHLLRRHGIHAAVEPLRARGTARRRLHDADLRQHADGAGAERTVGSAQQLQDQPTTPRSRGPSSRSWTSTMRTRSSNTGRPAA